MRRRRKLKGCSIALSIIFAAIVCQKSSLADDSFHSGAAQGDYGRRGSSTSNQSNKSVNRTYRTGPQSSTLVPTQTGLLAGIYGAVGMNFLPPTRMDSFVHEAGASAELIYGDEGTNGPPPYLEFAKEHRIGAGIKGVRSAGLTSGYSSHLPDAWGGDEFVKGPEFDNSGSGQIGLQDALLGMREAFAYLVPPAPPIEGPVPSVYPQGALPFEMVDGAVSVSDANSSQSTKQAHPASQSGF